MCRLNSKWDTLYQQSKWREKTARKLLTVFTSFEEKMNALSEWVTNMSGKINACPKPFQNPEDVAEHIVSLEVRCLKIFGPRFYPKGSLVIALVRLCVCPSEFKYLRDSSLVFSNSLHEARAP